MTRFQIDGGETLAKTKRKLKHCPGLIEISSSADHHELLGSLVQELRCENRSLFMEIEEMDLPRDLKFEFARRLYRWDQLSLLNLLRLLPGQLPKALEQELWLKAEQENRSLKEWFLCLEDQKFKAPNLPWRSFVRKVNEENLLFLQNLLFTETDPEELWKQFLIQKSRVVCKFPKRWKG